MSRLDIIKKIKHIGTQKNQWYDITNIRKMNATYNIIMGMRSNGKTYGALERSLERYQEDGSRLIIVRRWATDITTKTGSSYFDGLVQNHEIEKYTDGKWDRVVYRSSRWYFAKHDNEKNKLVTDVEPFAYFFALNTWEHDKGAFFKDVRNIIFDEFMTRGVYLPDEFVIFMNVISTVIRRRDEKFEIYMLANTVSMYGCPYWREMGLMHATEMEQGTIAVYDYGKTGNRVAVEYVKDNKKSEFNPTDKYFAFGNPRLNMITDGAWELAMYPHLPVKYDEKNVLFRYFILYEGDILQCNIIKVDDFLFTYIHEKTTPLKDPDRDLIYSLESIPTRNHRISPLKPQNQKERRISWFYDNDRVFYADNYIGEQVMNFLKGSS